MAFYHPTECGRLSARARDAVCRSPRDEDLENVSLISHILSEGRGRERRERDARTMTLMVLKLSASKLCVFDKNYLMFAKRRDGVGENAKHLGNTL
jgi:hypothetical protein